MPTCAVDVRSGLDGASGIVWVPPRRPTPHLLFPGRGLCGDIVVADIGIPAIVLKDIAPNTWENCPDLWLGEYPWPIASIMIGGRSSGSPPTHPGFAANRPRQPLLFDIFKPSPAAKSPHRAPHRR